MMINEAPMMQVLVIQIIRPDMAGGESHEPTGSTVTFEPLGMLFRRKRDEKCTLRFRRGIGGSTHGKDLMCNKGSLPGCHREATPNP